MLRKRYSILILLTIFPVAQVDRQGVESVEVECGNNIEGDR